MTCNPSLKLLAVGVLAVGIVATPALAAPAEQSPIASEQVGGSLLTVTPQITWQEATLRVSGPDGYALSKSIAPGTPVTAELLQEAEARTSGDQGAAGLVTARAALPDGRYYYEVVFTNALGAEVTHSDMFFVEGGAAVSRQTKRAELEAARAELAAGAAAPSPEAYTANDQIAINDAQLDNNVRLRLDNDGVGVPAAYYWDVADVVDRFQVWSYTASASTNRLTILRNGDMGIGTQSPADKLHIVDGFPLRLTNGSFDFRANIGGTGLWWLDDDGHSVVKMNHSAPSNALAISGTGVGVGTGYPDADLHVANLDGTGDTVLKLARSGTGSWNLGHTSAGVFTFSRVGTGGQEFTVRNRNDPVATLDVQGHVRGTSFKSTSSRALKTGFEALDPTEVLARVAEMPVTSWRYKTEEEGVRHFGPVAEDFQRLFGLGDGRTIATVDADGVAFAAIQGLQQQLSARDAEIESLKRSNADLEARMAALEARLQP